MFEIYQFIFSSFCGLKLEILARDEATAQEILKLENTRETWFFKFRKVPWRKPKLVTIDVSPYSLEQSQLKIARAHAEHAEKYYQEKHSKKKK